MIFYWHWRGAGGLYLTILLCMIFSVNIAFATEESSLSLNTSTAIVRTNTTKSTLRLTKDTLYYTEGGTDKQVVNNVTTSNITTTEKHNTSDSTNLELTSKKSDNTSNDETYFGPLPLDHQEDSLGKKGKIVPRKGVDLSYVQDVSTSEEDVLNSSCSCFQNISSINSTNKCVPCLKDSSDEFCKVCFKSSLQFVCCKINLNLLVSSIDVNNKTVENISRSEVDKSANTQINQTKTDVSQTVPVAINQPNNTSQNGNASSVVDSPVKKSKQKPTFTVIPEDKEVPESDIQVNNTTKDTVIPIIVFLLLVPLIGILLLFVYKKSKELWEKRHYNRMDFLIDGIYND